MAYADYAYYAGEYGGTMPEADFKRLSRQASAFLDRVTFERIRSTLPKSVMDRVRDACCAVADACLLNEQGGGVASETNDGVSVTYVAGVGNTKTGDQRLWEAAGLYLGGTGLLYRGVDCHAGL